MKRIVLVSILLIMAVGVFAEKKSPKREMRAVWIATVDNIDWPSKPGLSVEEQKKELITHLDQHKKNGMNTVIFQVRPATDAFYKSAYEPWSQWLTGEQGKAPDPIYDPLQFAVEECHKRAMELHAWMNPYRAVFLYKNAKTDPNHISNTRPELFLTYGKHKYFNPGLPETRDYVSKIVGDVVRRYDIDAIHFDDYFYPYKIEGEAFPDSESFEKHGGKFYPNQVDDWRRENVNLVIKQINDTIKSIKPWMPFGISPFGVWRNKSMDKKGSRTQAGQTNYDDLYADVLLWLKKDWIDYVAPQIYWHRGKKVANYKVIAKWWNKNSYGKPCYIGQGAYRLNPESSIKAWHSADEIVQQIKLNRRLKAVDGSMFFSAKNFVENRLGINEALSLEVYKVPALHIQNALFKGMVPASPELKKKGSKLEWTKQEAATYYVVYKKEKKSHKKVFCITSFCELDLNAKENGGEYSVAAVNRGHVESVESNRIKIK
ncbi:glycoside hydrolase family 10 protein [Marinifilum caeruleilacunae]|uniref:Glycoside hydrolase family 10 protein n=1 Tax=Marinifilum caeruleilacunae TaxID=2499076 RepID=A0ABX1X113_9BACT|nr:family 10 glycosylhydrolase [Marinifilum caeruleilacunae]NOU61831.1 glycoside hydrolase family 10 protein [Marinifilum caeruleilacunae]